MKKTLVRLMSVILTLTMLIGMISVTGLSVSAAAVDGGKCGDNLTWTFYDNGTLAISGTGDMIDYQNAYDNTDSWKHHNEQITKVVISEGITSIGRSAFPNCTALTAITIPNTVTSIGFGAFYNCPNLEVVNFGNSLVRIDGYAFESCVSLTELIFPSSLQKIAGGAFTRTTALTKVYIPENVSEIGIYAFAVTPSLVSIEVDENNQHFRADNNVLFTKDYSKLLCYPATKTAAEYTVPEGVVRIDGGAFYECKNLEKVVLPSTLEIIDTEAFRYCTSLKDVNIPDSIKEIGHHTFQECPVERLVFPEGLEYIGNETFLNCDRLSEIMLPDSVYGVGYDTFLGTAYYTDNTNWNNGMLFIGNHLIGHEYDSGSEHLVIPEGTVTVGGGIYQFNSDIKTVSFPSTLKGIGCGAFAMCEGIENIVIPDSVTFIGDQAFMNCTSMQSFIFGDGITEIYASTLRFCMSLTSLTIGKNVTKIGDEAFSACYSLSKVTIPDSVNSIGTGAFWELLDLHITIPPSVTYIADDCFTDEGVRISCVENSYAHQYALEHNIPVDFNTVMPDVVAGSWYEEGVKYCVEKGYFSGTDQGLFLPENALTREQFVIVLAKLDGCDLNAYTGNTGFADVPAGQWYSAAVKWAYQNGYANGVGNGNFGLGVNITREQLATFFYNYAKGTGLDINRSADLTVYSDYSSISDWAKPGLGWAVDAGLVSSTSTTVKIANPKGIATRAQAARIFMVFDGVR